jgi:hypothetical protein
MAVATPDALAAFRRNDRVDLALAVAFLVGLVATAVHPAGLVVGGVLVGLFASSLSRAVVLGLAFGISVLVAWALVLLWFGTVLAVATATPLVYVSLAAGLGLPTLGAVAVRGLV